MTQDEFEKQFARLLAEAMQAAKNDTAFAGAILSRLIDTVVKIAAIRTHGDARLMNDMLEMLSQAMFEVAHENQPIGKIMAAFDEAKRKMRDGRQ